MPINIRAEVERREELILSPHAQFASNSLGRVVPEEPDPVRTCYQRDRDRILHSRSFRRLKHKTQVFIAPVGDHYRTRLTHTLEVAQIARTIGRALQLNEDLIEAIAIGHDVGHPPFGHAGERAIDEFLQIHWSELGNESQHELPMEDMDSGTPAYFRHYEQSLRVVDVLEGLNLTHEVRDGIGGHSKGRKDISSDDSALTSTLEAAVVRISDRIAYLNHDIDDAIRSGMIEAVPSEFEALGTRYSERVKVLVMDVIESSYGSDAVRLSDKNVVLMNGLKEWMFDNVYLRYPIVYPEIDKAVNLVKELLTHFVEPGRLPEGYVGVQGAVDYVSGMTDRFAMMTFKDLKFPKEWDTV
ncbi:MAG TPA: deoxyguanosinetriphosphate triphosphohydrolase [Fimbriimonas sp.]|nr:deoxyguanosinetriphosphate triphosphohydrolase [Fimbriimonas sp.]